MVSKIDKEIEEQYLSRVLTLVGAQLTQRRHQSQEARSALYGKPDQGYTAEVAGVWAVKSATKATVTLEQQREAPYFGRIDFQEKDWNEGEEAYYIGKASLWDGNDLVIVDWRAPVSSMYYSCGIGPAGYRSPGGYIQGEISLKRQYTFSGNSLSQIHETGGANEDREEAVDELLLSVLRRNATAQMRQIVQSIQKEQDRIIRSSGHVVVVQGPAGSGKTIIALHRAAYLLYQMREGRDRFARESSQISAQRMLVFSPNAIFSDYISRVLPDLQEDGIRQIILDSHVHGELGRRIKGSKSFTIEQKEDYYEYMLSADAGSSYSRRALGSCFKSSAKMLDQISKYIAELDASIETCFQDVTLRDEEGGEDVVIHSRQELLDRYKLRRGQHGASLIGRLNYVITYLTDEQKRIETELKQAERNQHRQTFLNHRQLERLLPPLKLEIARLKRILVEHQQLKLTDQYLSMLRRFCSELSHLTETSGDGLYHPTETAISSNHGLYEDALPLLLLDGFYRGFTPMGGLNHAIVDEAQDYSLLHFEYIKNCLPEQCSMTIVGDINQATNPQINLPDYGCLNSVYSSGITRLELTRSYRSSSEITAFASRILGDLCIDNVRRTGLKPVLVKVNERNALQSAVAFYVKNHTDAGSKTVAVLCKTRKDCDDIHPFLEDQVGARRLTSASDDLSAGVVVLPVYLAKGLEFDAVVIPNADAHCYSKDTERRLLYTACTRALHELTLLYVGDPSPLLPIKRNDLYKIATWVPEHLQVVSIAEEGVSAQQLAGPAALNVPLPENGVGILDQNHLCGSQVKEFLDARPLQGQQVFVARGEAVPGEDVMDGDGGGTDALQGQLRMEEVAVSGRLPLRQDQLKTLAPPAIFKPRTLLNQNVKPKSDEHTASQQQIGRELLPGSERVEIGRKINLRRNEIEVSIRYFDEHPNSQEVVEKHKESLLAALVRQDQLEAMYESKCTVSRLRDELASCQKRDHNELPVFHTLPKRLQEILKPEMVAQDLPPTPKTVAKTLPQPPVSRQFLPQTRLNTGSEIAARRRKIEAFVYYFEKHQNPQEVAQYEEYLIAALVEQDQLEELHKNDCTASCLEKELASCRKRDQLNLPLLHTLLVQGFHANAE